MPLQNGFPGHSALTTFANLRRDLEGAVVRDAAGKMRAGIFPAHFNPLVTGRADMRVNILDHRAVQDRGGAIFLANVGTDSATALAAAPAANRRIDLIYEFQQSATLGDGASTAIFGVVQGTASATPVVPSLPANLSTAIPLATVEIPAGATTTLSAGVVITQLYQYTAMAGGTVPVRNGVELAAWTPADGAKAYNLADTREYVRQAGTWAQSSPLQFTAVVTVASSGAGGSASLTFPPGLFKVPPIVQLTKQSGSLAKYIPYVSVVTAAGVTVNVYSGDGTTSSGSTPIAVLATQASS